LSTTTFFRSNIFRALIALFVFLLIAFLIASSGEYSFKQVQDNAIYLIIIGVIALVMIGGLAGGLAFLTFNVDREARYDEAGITVDPLEQNIQQKRIERATQNPAPEPSELSQAVAAGGYSEMEASIGLENNKLGLWIFIASEMMFFTALIGAFVLYRAIGRIAVPEELNSILAAGGTFILIGSSFTAVMAFDSALEQRKGRFIIFMLLTIMLGSAFLGVQGTEWAELIHHGITPANDLFGTAFFVLTGFHGTHVLIGLIWLTFALLKGFRGDYDEQPLGVETFGLYWHFVDVVWILLFTIIYLI